MISPSPMKPPGIPILAGIVYFVLVFALGFMLGTVRNIFVQDAPSAGRLLGVLIELRVSMNESYPCMREA